MFASTLSRIALASVVLLLLLAFVARPSGGAGHEQVIVVRPHDTLWSIAASHYGGDTRAAVWRIQKRNALPGAAIHAGERLVLP